MKTDVVILAAGKGTRMKSDLPKVLTPVAGASIISRLLDAAAPLTDKPILVVGHKGDQVIAAVGDRARYVHQREQKGTGHAVSEVLNELGDSLQSSFIVMPGDHPLVKAETLSAVAEKHSTNAARVTLGTLTVPNYDGIYSVFNHYGRVIRNAEGKMIAIREYKDATEAERGILEVSPSYYCFDTKWAREAILKLSDNNASKELYLTDMIGIAVAEGGIVETVPVGDYTEALGINTPDQKSMIETLFFSSGQIQVA